MKYLLLLSIYLFPLTVLSYNTNDEEFYFNDKQLNLYVYKPEDRNKYFTINCSRRYQSYCKINSINVSINVYSSHYADAVLEVFDENNKVTSRHIIPGHVPPAEFKDFIFETYVEEGKEWINFIRGSRGDFTEFMTDPRGIHASTRSELNINIPSGGRFSVSKNSRFAVVTNIVNIFFNSLDYLGVGDDALFNNDIQRKEFIKEFIKYAFKEKGNELFDRILIDSCNYQQSVIDCLQLKADDIKELIFPVITDLLEDYITDSTIDFTASLTKIALDKLLKYTNGLVAMFATAEDIAFGLNTTGVLIDMSKDTSQNTFHWEWALAYTDVNSNTKPHLENISADSIFNSIYYLGWKGVMTGYKVNSNGDKYFGYDQSLTRGEFATIMKGVINNVKELSVNSILGELPEDDELPFTDSEDDEDYEDYIAHKEGIKTNYIFKCMTGSDNKFKAGQPIIRQEAILVLSRLFYGSSSLTPYVTNRCENVNQEECTWNAYAQYLYDRNIINNDTLTKFIKYYDFRHEKIKRGEIAVYLASAIKQYHSEKNQETCNYTEYR